MTKFLEKPFSTIPYSILIQKNRKKKQIKQEKKINKLALTKVTFCFLLLPGFCIFLSPDLVVFLLCFSKSSNSKSESSELSDSEAKSSAVKKI